MVKHGGDGAEQPAIFARLLEQEHQAFHEALERMSVESLQKAIAADPHGVASELAGVFAQLAAMNVQAQQLGVIVAVLLERAKSDGITLSTDEIGAVLGKYWSFDLEPVGPRASATAYTVVAKSETTAAHDARHAARHRGGHVHGPECSQGRQPPEPPAPPDSPGPFGGPRRGPTHRFDPRGGSA